MMNNRLFTIASLFLFFVCCNKKSENILIIKEYTSLIDKANNGNTIFEKPILKGFIPLDSSWEKGISSGKEEFLPSYESKPEFTEIASIPDKHNLNPYTSIWYQKTIRPDKDYVLLIKPDDGAQVFLDSIFVVPAEPDVYDLSSKTGKDLTITIRCMNQAMHGGLREAKLIRKSVYEDYKTELKKYNSLISIQNKVKLIPLLDQKIRNLANNALVSGNEDTIVLALKYFSEYTINLVDPFLQKTGSIYHVVWESDMIVPTEFRWGYDSTILDNAFSVEPDSLNMYKVSLDLEKNRNVYYKIKYPKTQTRLYHFNTHSDPSDKVAFSIWADSQSGWKSFKKITAIMSTYDHSFSVGVGDLVNNGKKMNEYQKLHRLLHPVSSKMPVYLIPGNHDYDGFYHNLFAKNYHKYSFNSTNDLRGNYFSFKTSNAMFIALDPNENFPMGIPEGSEQYQWLIEQLKSTEWQEANWHFILVHQPPFSQGWPGYHGAPQIKGLLDPLYEKYKIDAVITGHTHDYERLKKNFGNQPVHFVICGTAGGGIEPLKENSEWPVMDTIIKEHLFVHVELNSEKATFKAINTNNKLVDKFEIAK